MATPGQKRRSDCAVACTLDLVGDRWSLLIVRDLLAHGERRYADFAASGEAIPTNTLAERLRRLEEAGLLRREPYSTRPPRYGYWLTDAGRALGPVVDALAGWGLAQFPGTRRTYPAP